MKRTIALLLLFAVVAFALPVIASAKSPPGQAIHKQTLQKIQKTTNTKFNPTAEVGNVLKLSYTGKATFDYQAKWRPLIRERQRLQSRHELTKYSTSIEGFGLRPVLLL